MWSTFRDRRRRGRNADTNGKRSPSPGSSLSRAVIPAFRAIMRCGDFFRCIHSVANITTLLPLATDYWQLQVVSSGAMRE
jgi:hypothetical protein